FHQRRALGPAHRDALGRDLSAGSGWPGAPPFAALRDGPRRPGPVCADLVVRPQAAARRPGQRGVPDGLWGGPVPGRVHPGTGRLPGPVCRRPVDGSAAVAAHDHHWPAAVLAGCRRIVPLSDTLTVSVPPSRGAATDSSALAIIMRGMGLGTKPPPPSSIES